jgi:predicted CXXCH cytochrome family protein
LATKPAVLTESCANETCHASIITRKVMHGPVAQKKCGVCHQPVEPRDHRFKLTAKDSQLCNDCHVIKLKDVVHLPVTQGRCVGCHDSHGSDHRAILVADYARGLCLTCHKQEAYTQKKFAHGPSATGACILCHEAHSSWQPKLLIESPRKLCVSCHATVLPKDDLARHVHAPVKDNCTACHDSHASDLKYQLRQAEPELCLSCHKETKAAVTTQPVVHGAMTQPSGCSGCHAAHFSQLPKLARQPQPQMCLGCHDKTMKTAGGDSLTDMALLLKSNPQHHGPIREGECTACHRSHAGKNFRLLTAEYPPAFYAPFKVEQYGLCFSCHFPELVLRAQGSGLTRFRDGDRNLHRLHVNQEKGRTCRACHEVHASRRPFHIRDAVPFGTKGWMLEINFKQTPTGGSCAPGCHKETPYDHGGAARIVVSPTTQEMKK